MVNLIGTFSRLSAVRVLVIGDLMLDTYTTGVVKRISPEAPVSILHVQKEESRAGGSGNVVLNLISLGASVDVVGRVGDDASGQELLLALKEEKVGTDGLVIQKGFKTPVKNRLIADAQQILRVDFETLLPLPEDLEAKIIATLPGLLEEADIVAISDYGKGFLSRTLLKKVIQLSKEKKIPVIVDPKGDDFSKYVGATILKPNLGEAYTAAKLPRSASLDLVADELLARGDFEKLLITRSEAGMSLFSKEELRMDFPVRSREVKDVTGAGDTVLSMISVAIGSGIDIKSAAQLANIAAGIAIERLGCARVDLADIAVRLLESDAENKIFDEQHLFALSQALKGKRYCVLGIDADKGMTTSLFRTLKSLSSIDPQRKLILYVKDAHPCEEFISLLSSLSEVDFIVLKCESLKTLGLAIHPHEVFAMEEERPISLRALAELFDYQPV